MSLLLVTLPLPSAPSGAACGWAQWSGDGQQLLAEGSAPVALLPAGGDVTVIAPAAALSWHAVTLPQGSMSSAARLRAVLTGLLEEQLLDEAQALHFALAPGARTGTPAWVAACRRDWLHDAMQTLEAAGRRVMRIVPEFAPQPPDAPPLLIATGDADAARLTVCDAAGVATLPLDATGIALASPLPEGAAVLAEPAAAALAEALLGRPVPIVKTAERQFQATRSDWDLAQFDFATTGRARAGKKLAALAQTLWHAPRWRAARWGAAALVVAQLVGINAWAWKERNALEAKRAAAREILTRTFPAVRLVVDAPLQMTREVAALQQATGGVTPSDLEPMLGALATSLPPGRVPDAIDYNAGQLRLRGLGLQPSDLADLTRALAARGYGARAEGDLVLVQAEAPR